MADRQQHPYVEPQHLSDEEAALYELAATFEYQGRPATQEAICVATGLDGGTVAAMLERLTDWKVLVRTGSPGQPAYELARKDWSAAPGVGPHFPPGHAAGEQEPATQAPQDPGATGPRHAGPARRGQQQEARAERIRDAHLHGEQERGEQARAELQQHPEAGDG